MSKHRATPMDPIAAVYVSLQRERIIPDVLPDDFEPTLLFSVLYPNGQEVLLGNELTVEDAAEEPSIVMTPMNAPLEGATASGETDPSFTLVMVDPDAPAQHEPRFRQFRHWVITGLKGPSGRTSGTANFSALRTKAPATPYYSPGARAGTGVHRYTFVLFEEPAGFEIPADAVEHTALEKLERVSWNAADFGTKYGLKLVGANFFLIKTPEQ